MRRAELSYVIDTIRRFARQRRLTARLAPLFLILQRNRDWWAKAGPPGSGARLQLGGSRVIFQYFPGKGLQLHPLANFGRLNGYWYGEAQRRPALDGRRPGRPRVERNGFLAWEYYFALRRRLAAVDLGHGAGNGDAGAGACRQPAAATRAARGRGARARRLRDSARPRACASPQGAGDWYALYSFDPRLYVLNGQLQAVNGLRTYAEFAPADTAAAAASGPATRAAQARDRELRHRRLVALLAARRDPGPEANLNYHTLNRDFARNLCKGTSDPAYCDAADHFTQYLKQDPTRRSASRRAVAGDARDAA